LAEQVLDEISSRAHYQLWGDALLACNAVQDYLKSSGMDKMHEQVIRFHLKSDFKLIRIGLVSELPIQVEVSSFKKSIITNASFRTKKLPGTLEHLFFR